MIELLKASAGSGKTFNLAKNYIYLLLRNRSEKDAWRHILAVTFTNKATDEMKSRILEELYILSASPETSELAPFYLPGEKCMSPEAPVCKDIPTLRKAASTALSGILHDYGSFSVSTIDRFFQRALKSFTREAGHFTAYQVELDREELIGQSVERLLDGLSRSDTALLGYLKQGAMDLLENGKKMNLRRQLCEAAERLSSEEFRMAAAQLPDGKIPSREEIARLRETCRHIESTCLGRVNAAADRFLSLMEGAGLAPEDFAYGKTSLASALVPYRTVKRSEQLKAPGTRILNDITEPAKWFIAKERAVRLASLPVEEMVEAGRAFLDAVAHSLPVCKTVWTIRKDLWKLGVASELQRSYEALTREKNLLTLDDSNTLLRDIIDGSDAPFVYERLGVRYEHFLLDEFQDTAQVQWDNMLPLLVESQSHEGRAGGAPYGLIVGDIKQSIYRWRGSDWTLMQQKAPGDLARAAIPVLERPLTENYRSLWNIISFNNKFFRCLADAFDAALGEADKPIGTIYENGSLCQSLPEKKAGGPDGCVEVSFVAREAVFERTLSVIRAWRDAGVPLGDIAIIVRKNRQGAEAAEYLLSHDSGIRIVSDDSLKIRASSVVRRLVASLYGLLGKDTAINDFIAGVPSGGKRAVPGRSLLETCQLFLQAEDPALLRAHTLFIDAFLDFVQEYVEVNGNDLKGFLDAYEESDRSISSPEGSDAVRIITVHKSKGLQFPYVIYLNVRSSKELEAFWNDRKWCVLPPEDGDLAPLGGRAYDISFYASHENDRFREDWLREKRLRYIDVINTYYVAFTRPKRGLHIISDLSGGAAGRQVGSQLYRFVSDPANGFVPAEAGEGEEAFRLGEPYLVPSGPKDGGEAFPMPFLAFPAGERLRFSPDAGDFFGADGTVGVDASVRRLGTAYHRILSRVRHAEDLEASVKEELASGGIDAAQATEALDRLRDALRVGEERGFFPAGPEARILNEVSLMDAAGQVLRPDRVIVEGDRVTVVDYKFGEPRPGYCYQVRRYVDAFRGMGYREASGFLWYIERNEIVGA